jgi:signal transduction histidine kinase
MTDNHRFAREQHVPVRGVSGWRVTTAARIFALATSVGLIVTTGELSQLAASFLTLCLIATIMSIPAPTSALQSVAPIVEGALVALVLAGIGESATPLLVYLIVPPFVAGVQIGFWGAALATTAALCAGVASLVLGHEVDALPGMLEQTASWILVGLGMGLLGAWMRMSTRTALNEQQRYESAHRLLAQLHAVARDLPHGLDAPSLAQRTLSHSVAKLHAGRAMLVLRDESEAMVVLAIQGPGRFHDAADEDPLVATCWDTRKVQQRANEGDPDGLRKRAALPLRVGSRMVGVVVVDTPETLRPRALRSVQARLDEQSLRLESAMLFEQVRSMATVEERHRLAREIHDGIAQEVASLGYLVDDLGASTDNPEGRSAARALRGELTRIVNELRLSIFDLRVDVNQHGGLGQALSDYARDVGARSDMTVHIALAEGARLSIDIQTELLRIAQEAITNARKHAQASNLWLTLNTNGNVTLLRVEDDGVGSARPRNNHYGLRMMRERADRIGADLAITDRPRGGTSVVVALQPSTMIPGAHRADLSPAR